MLVFYVELICIVLVSSHDRTGISTADKVGTPRLYDSNAKAKATQEPVISRHVEIIECTCEILLLRVLSKCQSYWI